MPTETEERRVRAGWSTSYPQPSLSNSEPQTLSSNSSSGCTLLIFPEVQTHLGLAVQPQPKHRPKPTLFLQPPLDPSSITVFITLLLLLVQVYTSVVFSC